MCRGEFVSFVLRPLIAGVLLATLPWRSAAAAPEAPPDLHPFRESTKKGARYGYINHQGRIVILARFQDALEFRERRAAAKVGSRWGAIDETGRLAVAATHEEPPLFSDGLASIVRSSGQRKSVGFIDRGGKTVIPLRPGYMPRDFSGGLAHASPLGEFGYVDKTGKLAIRGQPDWRDLGDFSEGLASVMIDGNWGFINNRGRLVIPARYQPPIAYAVNFGCFAGSEVADPPRFSEGLAAVKLGVKAGFIDWSGRFVIEPRFDAAFSFSEGLAAVRANGKWGYVDRTGNVIVTPRFDAAHGFSEGLAPVKVNGLWGFIDARGTFAIPPQFRFARGFQAGLAEVLMSKTSWIYIDARGRKIWDSPTPVLRFPGITAVGDPAALPQKAGAL